MATTSINAYFIECITNMHVGSGDANYGVVDKLVQRDPVTNHPTIHASSLKGALREYFEGIFGLNTKEVNGIFGKEALNGEESASGDFKFFGADLVALPVRSNFKQFAMTLSPELIKLTNHKSNLLTGNSVFNQQGVIDKIFTTIQPTYDVYLEDEVFGKNTMIPILKCAGTDSFNDRFAIAEESKFTSYSKNLPVIARNQLNNGISKNLWYEEVVPHHSIFITFVATTPIYMKIFEDVLLKDGATIQIGGNASVGYGICKFLKISF